MKTFRQFIDKPVVSEWNEPKPGEKKDSVITRIQRHEKLAVKANNRRDDGKRAYHLDKVRELKAKHSVLENTVSVDNAFQIDSMIEMLDSLRGAGVDLEEHHLNLSELHEVVQLGETAKPTISKKSESRLRSLTALGVISKTSYSTLERVLAKVESGAASYNPQERQILQELLDNLIGLVTGDDTVYQRLRQSAKSD